MPDNPIVPDLVKHAGKVVTAQAALRAAMADVSAEIQAGNASSGDKPQGK